MALTLVQAATLSTDDLQRGVIETIIEGAPLLQLLPFHTVTGNAYAYVQEKTLPGADFRGVNEGYTESTGEDEKITETLAILGGDADVDRFIVQTNPGEVANQRAEQTRLKSKAVRMQFQDAFINGDTSSNAKAFNGLKKRLTGSSTQEISAATNGLPIIGTSDADRHAFLDKLDQLIAAVPGGPDILLTNAAILGAFKSAARRLTIYDETKDAFGKPVTTYQGIPVVDVGNKGNGSAIIPQTETQGSSSVTGSIYAVRFGRTPEERGVTGLTNGGVQVYDLGEVDDKPAFRTRIEFYVGLAVHGGRAAARLKGVLAS
jgi:hypothetical protein